jgi:hypothetical protein
MEDRAMYNVEIRYAAGIASGAKTMLESREYTIQQARIKKSVSTATLLWSLEHDDKGREWLVLTRSDCPQDVILRLPETDIARMSEGDLADRVAGFQ